MPSCRRRGSWIAVGWAALICMAVCAGAVDTRIWELNNREDLEKGTSTGVSITGDGSVVLSPGSEEIFAAGEPIVSALASGEKGAVLIGTSSPGRIYSGRPGTEAVLLHEDLGFQVSALLPDEGGGLIAAWNPTGEILRIDREGGREILYDVEENYVWALARDPEGRILAATGDPSRLLRITPGDPDPRELFSIPERNLSALAVTSDGTIYVGTDGDGLVLRVEERGEHVVVWDSDQEQISSLAIGEDGAVYASAVAGHEEDEEDQKKRNPKNEPSVVVRIDTDGRVETLWEGRGEPVFALAWCTIPGLDAPALLAGTGVDGRLYLLEGQERRTLVLDTEHEQVSSILPYADGQILLATANLGRVFAFGTEGSGEGSYVSPVHDATVLSDWGAFRWEGSSASGRIRFDTRSGTTSAPDDTWSDWEPVQVAAVRSPAARRLQWRARLTGRAGESGPELRSVEVAWLQRNRAPEITELTVHPPGLVYDKKLATESIEKKRPSRFSSEVNPKSNSKPFHLPGWQTLSWSAKDPNDDQLLYRIDLRPASDEDGWFPLQSIDKGSAYAWDARSLPDGRYLVRLTASDKPSNPAGSELETSRTEGPFLVDTRAPEARDLAVIRHGGQYKLSFRAADQSDIVASAAVSLRGRPWSPVLPDDGIPDEPAERFAVPLPDAKAGDLVVVMLTDRAGNVGTASAIVR